MKKTVIQSKPWYQKTVEYSEGDFRITSSNNGDFYDIENLSTESNFWLNREDFYKFINMLDNIAREEESKIL